MKDKHLHLCISDAAYFALLAVQQYSGENKTEIFERLILREKELYNGLVKRRY
ncbi:hypothetical protein [uncultured Streptococcus sp.]|uniref:hypothetical protein n=1 Tax=uncultured Streptococcus sp. TaxID=83427 RepID=UPI00206F572D|nr:hypothetical protein [uncultured Streptococcus sp.]DAI43822.1 MAG TPA: replication regulatory protein [Inoviridae sp.]